MWPPLDDRTARPRRPGAARLVWAGVATELDVETPHGPARVHVHHPAEARGALALGHGAGGGIAVGDLVAATEAALAESFTVALVEQPYRVAGRRSPAPAQQLDAAWTAVVDQLGVSAPAGRRRPVDGCASRVPDRGGDRRRWGPLPRFPAAPTLRPRRRSRLAELDAVTVPTLVVQGARDPFGMPPPAELRTVVEVAGDHSLRTDLGAVADAVRTWLRSLV